MVGAQEAAKVVRAFEAPSSLNGSIVAADWVVVLHADPVTLADLGNLANEAHFSLAIARVHYDTVALLDLTCQIGHVLVVDESL